MAEQPTPEKQPEQKRDETPPTPEEMLRELFQGYKRRIIPMLDEHQKVLEALPSQLKESFAMQGKQMKDYIDSRLGIAPSSGQPGQPGAPAKAKSIFEEILELAKTEIDKAGGLSRIVGGSGAPASTTASIVDQEIADLLRVRNAQDRLRFRDFLKAEVSHGPQAGSGAPPTVLH